MKGITTLALAVALAVAPQLLGEEKGAEKGKKGAMELVGGYTLEKGERGGQALPDAEVEGTLVRFTKDKVVVTDKDKKEVYVATYKLDSSEKPCRITMTSVAAPNAGAVAKGLIEKEGDTIRLIYALPGGDTPSEFKTKEKQLMFVMKNRKK